MKLVDIYDECYRNDHTSSESFVRDKVVSYFIDEVVSAENFKMQIGRFMISKKDFDVISLFLTHFEYNFGRRDPSESVGTLLGIPVHLKSEGDVEVHYKYPEDCGYLGIFTKNEIN